MRSRPEIEISLPKAVSPGGAVPVKLTLRSGSETPVDRITITLTGVQTARTPEQEHHTSQTFHSTTVTLRKRGVLKEGERVLKGSFDLPPDAPISYIGYVAEVRYSITATVVIPWWPDASETAELLVVPRPRARPAKVPRAASSESAALPLIEMAIDDCAFGAGDMITGGVAISNLQGRRIGGMDISLVGFERLAFPHLRGGERVIEAHRHTKFASINEGDDGREIALRIPVPRDATPSFRAGIVALEWVLEARLDLGVIESVKVTIPLSLGAFARQAAQTGLAPRGDGPARPKVGSRHWRDVWSEVADAKGLSLDLRDLRLSGVLEGVEVSIAFDQSSERRKAIGARLLWDDLGLDLQIKPKQSALARVFAGSGDEFARRFRLSSRYAEQAEALLSPALKSALLAFDSARAGDKGARLTSIGPAHDATWMSAFVDQVAAVARAAREASSNIPPPPPMASMLAAWEAFAAELGGRLTIGSMTITDGHFEGGEFAIETCFEGSAGSGDGAAPKQTKLTLSVDPPLSSALDLSTPAALSSAPRAIRAVAASILERASAIQVSEDSIEVSAPAPIEDPSSLRDVMRGMLTLAQRLAGDHRAGPYR